jgi:hypothetical protein
MYTEMLVEKNNQGLIGDVDVARSDRLAPTRRFV